MPKNTVTITIQTNNRENVLAKIEALKATVAEHMVLERDLELKNQLEALLNIALKNIDEHGFSHPNSQHKNSQYRGFELNPNELSDALDDVEKSIKKFNAECNTTPSGDDTQENHYSALKNNLTALQKSFNYRVTPDYLKSKKRKDYLTLAFAVAMLVASVAAATTVLVLFAPAAFPLITTIGFASLHSIGPVLGCLILGALDLMALASIPLAIISTLTGHKTLANKISPNAAIDTQLKDSGILKLVEENASKQISYQNNGTMTLFHDYVKRNAENKAHLIEAEINSTKSKIEAYTRKITSLNTYITNNADTFKEILLKLNTELDRIGYAVDKRFPMSLDHLNDSINTTETLLSELAANNTLDLINNPALNEVHITAVEFVERFYTLAESKNDQALLTQKNEALKIKLAQLRSEPYAARKCEAYQKEGRVDIKEKDNNRFADRRIQGDEIGRFTLYSKKVNQQLHQLAVDRNQIRPEDFVLEPVKLKK